MISNSSPFSSATPCPDRAELEELIDGRLCQERHVTLEQHIWGCANCQAAVSSLDEPRDGYASALQELADLAVEYARRPIQKALEQIGERPWSNGFGRRIGHPAALDFSGTSLFGGVDCTLGDFRILRQVGRGGMGIVYEAQQISLGRRIALKTLPSAGLLDHRRLQRFQNEARAAASLQHPHIVPVHAVGSDRGVYYYAMQFVDGINLAELIQELRGRRSPCPAGRDATTRAVPRVPDDTARLAEVPTSVIPHPNGEDNWPCPLGLPHIETVLRLVIDAARALDYAHEQGVVHRDIKPSNLMLDRDGTLWITDFGLARIDSDPTVSATGEVLGTLRYMSPEQALGKRGVVDHRSDIYSLGVTLYEMLTLTPIFPDVPDHAVLAKIASEDPTPPRRLNPSIPTDLETVLQKAMSKDATERFTTAKDFADELKRVLDRKPIETPRPRFVDRTAKWVRQHPNALAVAALVLLLITSFGVLQSIQSSERGRLIARLNEAAGAREQLNGDLLAALGSSQASERHAQDLVYVADVGLAAKAVEQDDLSGASNILDRWDTAAEGFDRRGFEWNWLRQKCTPASETRSLSSSELHQVRKSPVANLVAVAAGDGNIYLLDALTLREKRRIPSGQGEPSGIQFFPDGSRLASAGEDGTLCLWDPKTGQRILSIRAFKDSCKSVAITRDGGRLIASGSDGNRLTRIKVFSTKDGACLRTLYEHDDWPGCLAVSADGTLLAASTDKFEIGVWKLSDLSLMRTLNGHEHRVYDIAFHGHDKRLVSGGGDRTVRDWNLEDGSNWIVGRHLENVQCVAVAEDKTVVAGDRGGMVRTWNLMPVDGAKGGFADNFIDVRWEVATGDKTNWAAMTSDASMLFAASPEKLLSRDVATGAINEFPVADRRLLRLNRRGTMQVGDISSDGNWIVYFNEVFCRDLQAKCGWSWRARIAREADDIFSVRVSPGGKSVALGNRTGQVYLHDLASTRPLMVLDDPRNSAERAKLSGAGRAISQMAFSSDGKWLAAQWAPDVFPNFNIWNLTTRQPVRVTYGGEGFPMNFAYMPRSDQFITCGFARDVRFWSYHDGLKVDEWLIGGQCLGLNAIAANPDESLIAIGDESTIPHVRIWNTRERREIWQTRRSCSFLQFSADGMKLLSAGHEGGLTLWNLPRLLKSLAPMRSSTHSRHRSPQGTARNGDQAWPTSWVAHRGRAQSLAWVPENERIISVGDDGACHIVMPTATSEVERISLSTGANLFNDARFADDGTMLSWYASSDLWLTNHGREVVTVKRPPDCQIGAAAIRRNGSLIAWTQFNGDGQIHLHDRTGRPSAAPLSMNLPKHTGAEWLDFVPGTSLLLVRTGGALPDIRIYDLEQRRQVFQEFNARADVLALSPDARKIAFAKLKTVHVMDLPPKDNPIDLLGHRESVEALAFSPDGNVLVTASDDRTVRVWDTTNGMLLHKLQDHRAGVHALAISPDGKTLASGDLSGTIKLWHLATGNPLFDLPYIQERCCGLAFSPDGLRLVSRYENHQLHKFTLRSETKLK